MLPYYGFSQIADLKPFDFSVENGVTAINTIKRLNDGYLWVGFKDKGVGKFDGSNIRYYDSDDGLRDNNVHFIYQDNQGDIWAATEEGGLARFEGESFIYYFTESRLHQSKVVAVIETIDGAMIVVTDDLGIYTVNDLLELTIVSDPVDGTIVNDVELYGSKLWVATNVGCFIFDSDNNNFDSEFDHHDGVETYVAVSNGNAIYLGTNSGLSIVTDDGIADVKAIRGTELGAVYAIAKEPHGHLFISTENLGLIHYDPESREYEPVNDWDGDHLNDVTEIYKDDESQFWLLSESKGLLIWRNRSFMKFGEEITKGYRSFYSLWNEDDITWLGIEDGLIRFDKSTESSVHYPFNGKSIWDIVEFDDRLLLLASDNRLYNFENTRFRRSNLIEYTGDLINDMFTDSRGNLWLGTENGIVIVDENGTRTITTEDGLSNNFIWHFFEDSYSNIWISTNSGVSIYRNETFEDIEDIRNAGYSGQFRYVTEDNNRNIWVGTTEGVLFYDVASNSDSASVRRFNNDDGLLVLDTQFLIVDSNNILWQGTSAGIQSLNINDYMDKGKTQFIHYGLSEKGFGVSTFHNAVSEENDELILFGSKDGLYELHTELASSESKGPMIQITGFSTFRRTGDGVLQETNVDIGYDFSGGEELTFAFSENNFRIQFNGIDFNDPENLLFSYRINNGRNDWSRFSTEREIQLLDLVPGKYEIQFKSKGIDGIETAEPISININVVPPFWKTSWFYGFVVIALIGVYYIFDKIKYQLYERDHFKQLVEERTQHLSNALKEKEILLQEVHHRIKNNLAVISGLFQLQTINVDNEEAQRILNESQLRIKSIALIHEKLYQNDTLANINFRRYIEELVHIIADSYNYEKKPIEIDLQVDDLNITLDQSIPCGLILNELVSNSYEHAFKGKDSGTITILFKEGKEGMVNFVVKDDGVGFPGTYSRETATSLGVNLVHTLVAQLQGELRVNGSVGTEFDIQFKREGY